MHCKQDVERGLAMKTKYLGGVAACVLALTISAANATTYDVNLTDQTGYTAYCPFPQDVFCQQNLAIFNANPTHRDVTGTLSIDNGVLTSIHINEFYWANTYTLTYGTSPGSWVLENITNPLSVLNLSYNGAGIGDAIYTPYADYPYPVVTYYVGGTIDPVPLPAALPLFATGLAGLGLLGWRRKKPPQSDWPWRIEGTSSLTNRDVAPTD
jgi:hypothetical protein